jgi:hypothetical protein
MMDDAAIIQLDVRCNHYACTPTLQQTLISR